MSRFSVAYIVEMTGVIVPLKLSRFLLKFLDETFVCGMLKFWLEVYVNWATVLC